MYEIPVSLPEYVVIGGGVEWNKVNIMKMKDEEIIEW